LKRISDPFFFQSFGCLIGFDFHSSGLTTTVCGALKEALNKTNVGVFVAGGKGAASLKTPLEIAQSDISTAKIEKLQYASRMAAKVDNALIQDGFQLYHHCFFFTEKGSWSVIQQGMNLSSGYARRYHWLSDNIASFVYEPHSAICCDKRYEGVLDMTSRDSSEAQKISVDIVKENPANISVLNMKREHTLSPLDLTKRDLKMLKKAYELQPENYEELVAIRGVGPKSIRALALISELVYGKPASWKDPAKFSFAHGGKDGFPYPVDRANYDKSIEILKRAIEEAKTGEKERIQAIKRLKDFCAVVCCKVSDTNFGAERLIGHL